MESKTLPFKSRCYDEKEVAEDLHVAVKTLQYWRSIGKGPEYYKFERSVRYPKEGIEKYKAKNLRRSTAEYES